MLNRKPVFYPSELSAPSVSVLEGLEGRQMLTAAYDIGMNINGANSAALIKGAPILKSLGVKSVRLWTGVTDFNDHSEFGALKVAKAWHDAGFNVDMEISTKTSGQPSVASITGFFQWAMSDESLKSAVDEWEIGNEPDHREYWKGSLPAYVTNFLTPAYNVLHAAGETVISAGPSWNPKDVQTMIDAGMLNVTDYVGFHPYAKGVEGVKKVIAQIDAVVDGRKPIAATEWSVRGISGTQAWADAIAEIYPAIKAGFAMNHYFAMKVSDALAGPGGILNADLSKHGALYDAFNAFQDDTGGLNTGYTYEAGTTPGGTTTGGSTPSGSGSISGTLFDDADGDGKLDSGEVASGARVVFIDANGNGKLDSGEKATKSDANGKYTFNGLGKGTYKVSRMFTGAYKLSNGAKYVTASLGSGQKVTGVNLGSVAAGTTPAKPSNPTSPANPTKPTTPTPPTSSAPSITAILVLNAKTGAILGSYTQNATLKLSSLPTTGVAIAAITTAGVKSAKLTGLGKSSLQNTAPYTLLNDGEGKYVAWTAAKGSYTFTAAAYSGKNGSGTKGATMSVTLTIA